MVKIILINNKNKNSNNTDDAFCVGHEYKQWPKSWFEIRFKKKKMSVGHFTTIPCEPNTASRKLESHFFKGIGTHANSMVCAKFPVFRTFMNFS